MRRPEIFPKAALATAAGRRPITCFLVLAFGLAYPLMTLVVLAGQGVLPGADVPPRLGLDLERAASLLMLLALFAAALAATALERGRAGVGALLRRMFRPPAGLRWWLVTVLALPAGTVGLALLLGDALRPPDARTLAGELGQALVAFLLVNLWEEGAWSGFLQTRLERRHGFLAATLLTAVPFTAIHLPLQVINGNTRAGSLAVTFLLLLVLSALVRLLTGLVRRGAGDSVMAAALIHTSFNRSNNTDGLAADLLIGSNRSVATLLATLLLTVILTVALRRQLGRRQARAGGGSATAQDAVAK